MILHIQRLIIIDIIDAIYKKNEKIILLPRSWQVLSPANYEPY